MTPEEFQSHWRNLPIPVVAGQLEAVEIKRNSGVWIARDHSDRAHLLVRVPPDVVLDIAGTHGMGISVVKHRVPDQPDASYIDLICLDPAVTTTFAAVAVDIAAETVAADHDARRAQVIGALNEWRWFWGVDPTRMTAKDAVGLFGELWFLLRWAGLSPASVGAWDATNGARHDFQWPERSVEVKTTSRSGLIAHTIQHLEQLENPETGDLYLYSLRVARDVLAANTLHSLVEAAANGLSGHPETRVELMTKLGGRGYTPAAREQSIVPYRIIEEKLYRVEGQFPRLTRESFPQGLPVGVSRISYQLNMNVCDPWTVDRTPENWPED